MTTNWQQPAGGPPAQPGNADQGTGKRFAVVAVLLVVIAGLAAGAGLFITGRDSDTTADDARYVVTETVAADPVFELASARGADPFFPLEVQLVAFQEEQEQHVLDEAEELLAGSEPGQQVEVPEFDVAALDEAVKTGLYGGTEENTCDPERLISFLYANPDLGEAWAKVQGIEFDGIADYIRSLDIRILAEDTNVLNHGFNPDTGAPYEIDTILAAGTAVLVDEDGDIRTRCYCGNPIKPKPPEHMPPRCVVWLEHVYIEPIGNERRANAVRDVLLTGRETTVGGAQWHEVTWGDADEQQGWVRADNLRTHYCPPEQIEWHCPGPDDVPVWADPDATDQVGWHSGSLHTTAGTTEIFGPVQPVGTPNPTVINGFMLIRFTQANNLQNSAWIDTNDLKQDEEDCYRLPMCVDTEGPVFARGGGAIIDAGGVMPVEFTGRFVTEVGVLTEVRLLEQAGTAGWISTFYSALDDDECEQPRYECVTDYGEAGAIVYRDSVGNDPIGHVYNATVTRLGPEQDGRVFVEMATPGGPQGWIDAERFTADIAKCQPYYNCYVTTGPAYHEFATEGDMIGAQSASIIGVVGKRAHGEAGDPNTYTRIDVAGLRYWIAETDLLLAAAQDCVPTTDVDCPTYGWPAEERSGLPPRTEDIAALLVDSDSREVILLDDGLIDDRPTRTECCVSALYETPDTSTLVMGLTFPVQVTVVGSVVVNDGGGDELWYLTGTGDYFHEMHVVFGDCASECPRPVLVPLVGEGVEDQPSVFFVQVEEPREYYPDPQPAGDCCITGAFTGIDSGIDAPGDFPRFVEVVSGPHAPAPGWYLSADGDWFAATQVVPPLVCEQVDCPNPMVAGIYDQQALERDTERTVALASVFLGDTAECCAEGDIFTGPSFDESLGAPLVEPTSVVVLEIDGDWYRVVIQDFVAWIHISQFTDLDECDAGDDLPCANLQGAIDMIGQEFQPAVSCCVSLRVRTVSPADAGPGDWDTVEPPALGDFVETIEHDGETWYQLTTDEYGTIWARADNLVDASACDRDVECPANSVVAVAIVDDFENGPYNQYSCCVSMQDAAGGQVFRVVTLTGNTEEQFGVFSYETLDGEWILETDFVSGGDCRQTCPDGQTIVEDLRDCPPTVVVCPGGEEVASLNECPLVPPVVVCPGGEEVASLNECPAEPPGVSCPDGSVAQTVNDCAPVNTCPDSDQDSICDSQDNCRDTPNPNQNNSDGDTIGDACDNCVFVTNGFQDDRDDDGIGDSCELPDCPAGQLLNTNECCPAGSVADGNQCFCESGFEVVPGGTCPAPCPADGLQLNNGECCPTGSVADGNQCFCESGFEVAPGGTCPAPCPADGLQLNNGECCPTGSVADGNQCFCESGFEVAPGGTCPPPCPADRQLVDGDCCPAGTTAGSVDCFCPDQSLPVAGVGCTKACPGSEERVPVDQDCPPVIGIAPLCSSDLLRGDGVCCPEGTVPFLSNNITAVIWECVEPLR